MGARLRFGESLDYVYRNRARGWTPIGRLIDRIYLGSPGWQGIRARKRNLEHVLLETIERMHAAGEPIRLLDVATGHGRYVLETLDRLRQIPIAAELRDWDQKNVDAARQMARDMEIEHVVFARGDAFDRASLESIRPAPTLVIVSGLYELSRTMP